MSAHPNIWLQAYHDGQLSPQRQAQVEQHLDNCPQCRAELAELQVLSSLLSAEPLPAGLTPSDTFAAQVNLRLPRKPKQPAWQHVLHRSWQAVPFGLLGSWAFVQAVLIVAGLLMLGVQLVPGGETMGGMFAGLGNPSSWNIFSLPGFNPLQSLQVLFNSLSQGGPLGWAFLIDLALTGLIGLLYLSWLASWWVRHSANQSTVNGRSAQA